MLSPPVPSPILCWLHYNQLINEFKFEVSIFQKYSSHLLLCHLLISHIKFKYWKSRNNMKYGCGFLNLPWHIKPGITLWKGLPFKCKGGLPSRLFKMTFSPVHKHLQFTHTFCQSCIFVWKINLSLFDFFSPKILCSSWYNISTELNFDTPFK